MPVASVVVVVVAVAAYLKKNWNRFHENFSNFYSFLRKL